MIGNFVILKRKELGLDRKELAEKVKCTYTYLCLIENNKRRIGEKKIQDFAKVLKVSQKELKKHNVVSKADIGTEKRLIERQLNNINKQLANLETQRIVLEEERKVYCEKLSLLNVSKTILKDNEVTE